MTIASGFVHDDVEPRTRSRRFATAGGTIVAFYVAFVAVGTAIGLLIVHVLDYGRVGHLDERIEEAFARHRGTTLNHVTAFLSGMANTLPVAAAAIVLAVVWRLVAKEWKALALLAIGLVLEVMSFVTMAAFVGRNRPDVVRLDQSPPTSSFPSGHTAACTVLYGTLAVLVFSRTRRVGWRILVAVVAILVPLAVGFGRMYRGMHHPTDVLCGALLGIGALTVAVLVVRRWNADEPQVAEGPSGLGP
jgi:membrane-associated phospholipid phosphatase